MKRFDKEVAFLHKYLHDRGYWPGNCVDFFIRGARGETLVVHFAKGDPRTLGDGDVEYVDCPSTIVAMLNLETGTVTIPEMY